MDDKELDLQLDENKDAPSGKKQTEGQKKIVRLALKHAKSWADANSEAITRSKKEKRAIITGDHWPEKERTARTDKGLPCLTLNHGIVHRDGVAGEILQNMPRGKFRGFDNANDPKMAEIGTSILRRVEANSNIADIDTDTIKQALTSGYPAWQYVYHDYPHNSDNQEIFIRHIPAQYSVMLDPNATAIAHPNLGGPKWGMLIEDMPKADYQRDYPESSVLDALELDELETEWRKEDTVRVASYFLAEPRKNKRLMVNGKWFDEGSDEHAALLALELSVTGIAMPADKQGARSPKDYLAELKKLAEDNGVKLPIKKEREATVYDIMHYKLNCREILEGPKKIAGEFIPLIPFEGKYDWLDDGKKFYRGVYSNALDANKMQDLWASKAAEVAATGRQYKATQKQIGSYADLWENPVGHKVLYYEIDESLPGGSSPTEINTTSELQHDIEMMQYAGQEIKDLTNRHEASLGARGNETSGKAILARQQQGNNSNYEFPVNFAKAIRYRTAVIESMIPEVYDYEMAVKIIGEDGREKGDAVTINQPAQPGQLDDVGEPVQEYLNDVTKARFNTVVDVGPSFTTQREEAAELIKAMSQGNPLFAELLSDLVLNWQDWPGKDEASKRMRFYLSQKYPGMVEASESAQIKQAVGQVEQQAGQAMAAAEQKIQQSEQEKATLVQQLQAEQQRVAQATQAMKDKATELSFKDRELQLKEREMSLKEQEAQRAPVNDGGGAGSPQIAKALDEISRAVLSVDRALKLVIKNGLPNGEQKTDGSMMQ